jgi:hypothetical protein
MIDHLVAKILLAVGGVAPVNGTAFITATNERAPFLNAIYFIRDIVVIAQCLKLCAPLS